MKILAAFLLGAMMAAVPALAQEHSDRDDMAKKTQMHHMARHHDRYKRDYKSDQEEHQVTEDLNKQYRGVNAADAH